MTKSCICVLLVAGCGLLVLSLRHRKKISEKTPGNKFHSLCAVSHASFSSSECTALLLAPTWREFSYVVLILLSSIHSDNRIRFVLFFKLWLDIKLRNNVLTKCVLSAGAAPTAAMEPTWRGEVADTGLLNRKIKRSVATEKETICPRGTVWSPYRQKCVGRNRGRK